MTFFFLSVDYALLRVLGVFLFAAHSSCNGPYPLFAVTFIRSFTFMYAERQSTILKMSNLAGTEMSAPTSRKGINRIQKQKLQRGENESTQQIMDVFCINIAECVSVYVPKC